ncbi:MAG: SMI1/KNR4 family protein [Planctomycetota bacterium]
MDKDDWLKVLARVPAGLKVLRPPASSRDIDALEEELHCALPESYRGFLELHDGGTIDGLVIFGIEELRAFDTGSFPSHLIPFHPVTDDDFECFDTSRPDVGEYPVVWYGRGSGAEEATTYTDFIDWLLDQLLGIVGPTNDR